MQRICGAIVSAAAAGLLVAVSLAHGQDRPAGETGAQSPRGETPPSLDQAARLLFETARTAFENGDYETALERFKQAYAASPRPALLYNIATTADMLRRDDEALAAFERYLREEPAADDRPLVEARIRALRATIAERDRAQGAHAGGAPPALFFAAGGLAVASGALAIWAGVTTLSLNDDYEAYATSTGATQEMAKALFDDASSRQLLANVFIVGTALFGVTAAVLALVTDWGASDDEDAPGTARVSTTPTLSLDAHGAVAGLRHSF